MTRKLSKPQVILNGTVIPIVSSSLKVTYGYGKKIVETQTDRGIS